MANTAHDTRRTAHTHNTTHNTNTTHAAAGPLMHWAIGLHAIVVRSWPHQSAAVAPRSWYTIRRCCHWRRIMERTRMFGMSFLLSSMAPVEGEVSLVRSHFVMAVRS